MKSVKEKIGDINKSILNGSKDGGKMNLAIRNVKVLESNVKKSS